MSHLLVALLTIVAAAGCSRSGLLGGAGVHPADSSPAAGASGDGGDGGGGGSVSVWDGSAGGGGDGSGAGSGGGGGSSGSGGSPTDAAVGVECLDGHAAVVEGNVDLRSQAAVDALVGVRDVKGHLWIEADQATPITSLASLGCLSSVGDELRVKRISAPNLIGLHGITTVGGSVWLSGNHELTSLMGLGGLSTILGNLYITNNWGVTTLDGLDNLSEHPYRLYIDNNPKLSRCVAASFATELGRTCDDRGNENVCRDGDVCTCTGNLNDVVCD